MPKSRRKVSKTKPSSKLTLNPPTRRSLSPLLPQQPEDDNMEGFEDIETVNLTRDVPIEPPA
ncbi:hypothetical protein MMC16_002530, partial [Acarospora aff. strigata]|nr:hypothetical protein [Acarospora aff. strigata]